MSHELFPDDEVGWIQKIKTLQGESISSIEEVAKQMIGLDGIISGIYFGAMAFSKFGNKIMPYQEKIIFLLPVIFWFLSLLASVMVITPKQYQLNPYSPENAQKIYERIIFFKRLYLSLSLWMFVFSIASILVVLFIYL